MIRTSKRPHLQECNEGTFQRNEILPCALGRPRVIDDWYGTSFTEVDDQQLQSRGQQMKIHFVQLHRRVESEEVVITFVWVVEEGHWLEVNDAVDRHSLSDVYRYVGFVSLGLGLLPTRIECQLLPPVFGLTQFSS